jgi:hypothetical protein
MSTAGFADVLSTINGRILPSPPSMAPDLLFESFGFGFSKPDLKLLESFPLLRPSTVFRGSYASFSHAGQPPSASSRWICLVLLAFVVLILFLLLFIPALQVEGGDFS